MNTIVKKMIFIFSFFCLLSAQESKLCEERVKLFCQKHIHPEMKNVGQTLGFSIPEIDVKANTLITVYDSLLLLFELLFKGEPSTDKMIPDSQPLELRIEELKNKVKNLLQLFSIVPPSAFEKYSFNPVGIKGNKNAQLQFENTTNLPWIINFIPSNKSVPLSKSNQLVETKSPFFRVFLKGNEKHANIQKGTWFPIARSYNNESYTITEKNGKHILSDNFTKQEIESYPPQIINTSNTL